MTVQLQALTAISREVTELTDSYRMAVKNRTILVLVVFVTAILYEFVYFVSLSVTCFLQESLNSLLRNIFHYACIQMQIFWRHFIFRLQLDITLAVLTSHGRYNWNNYVTSKHPEHRCITCLSIRVVSSTLPFKWSSSETTFNYVNTCEINRRFYCEDYSRNTALFSKL